MENFLVTVKGVSSLCVRERKRKRESITERDRVIEVEVVSVG